VSSLLALPTAWPRSESQWLVASESNANKKHQPASNCCWCHMPRLTEIGNIKLSIVTPLVQHIEINAKVTVGRASDAWQRARCTRTGQPGNIWLPTDVLTVNRPSRRKPATKRTIFHAGLGLWGLQKYFVGPEATVTITLSEPSKSGKGSFCLTNMGNN
jgi:hypothetical protein